MCNTVKYFQRLFVSKPIRIFNFLLVATFILLLYLLANEYQYYNESQLTSSIPLRINDNNNNNNNYNIGNNVEKFTYNFNRFKNRNKSIFSNNNKNLSQNNEKKVQEILTYLAKSDGEIHKERPKSWLNIFSDTAQAFYKLFSPNNHLKDLRQWAVEKQRSYLRTELIGYKVLDKKKSIDDYIIEKGGRPIINAIFTTWRSGSTFVAEVVERIPGTFYHYEPLLHFGIVRVRSGSLAEEGIRVIRDLFNCKYMNLTDHVKYGEDDHPWVFNHNSRIWQYCEENVQVCADKRFLSNMCKMFPFQILKTVRMRLSLAKTFLDDPTLNLRVLLLVRDPRGTLQSRRHRDWCPGNPDCESPQALCSDLEDDYKTAIQFMKEYPGRFMALRYEDISLNPYSAIKKLFNFFQLTYDSRIELYLDNHTVVDVGGVSSTFRDSKNAPFHWRQDYATDFEEIEKIQSHCSTAMKLWGYKQAIDSFQLVSFNPLDNPPWDDMIIEQDKMPISTISTVGLETLDST